MELDLNIDSNGNVIVNTLSEYVAYISQLQATNEGSNERFFFRGQSNKNWDVRPCLFRENNLTIESDIISEACARAPFEFDSIDKAVRLRPNDFRECSTNFEILTKLQHYGLPTRMLDVTLNPLVALYFACAKCEDKENYDKNYKESDTIDVDSDHSFDNEYDVDGAVYYRRAYGHKHNSDDIDLLARIAEMDFSGDIVLHQLVEKLGLRSQIKQAEDFEELAKVMQNAYFVISTFNNERLIRQSGAFLLSGSINIQLNKSDYGASRIEKSSCSLNSQFASERIIIPAGSKESLLEELNFYNINQGALFPELEHQMAYIKYSMCKSNVRSASSFEKIDFDAIKAEESKESVEIAESVVREELVDKAIYDIISQYISDDAIKQNVLRIITRQTEYIDWANKEATISDLRRKIKRSLSLQSISSDVATQSARNMVSQLVNLYVKK